MFIKYISTAVTLVLGKIIVMLLAPVVALPPFVRFAEEGRTTGFPSQFPGKQRAFLVRPLMWMQTHDDCLDAFWYAKREGRWFDKYDQVYFDTHGWLRYYCYVKWLWRNAAYGLAHSFGYRQHDLVTRKVRGSDQWNTGQSFWFYELVSNGSGRKGFEFKAQWVYSSTRQFEARLGWGLHRYSPHNLAILYVRVIPFKQRK